MTLHKATPPHPDDPTCQNCTFCHRRLTRVPGGNGPTWIHPDGHVMAGPSNIQQMWAFVIQEEHGEGIPAAFDSGTGMWMPLVAADEDRVESLRPIAVAAGQAAGKAVKLVKFSNRTELEEVYAP